jgi:acyl-homoserine lactone acylase PvdQ
MVFPRRWTAWNLTAAGWHRSDAFDNQTDAMQYRFDGTLLAVVSSRRADGSEPHPTTSTVYRSPNKRAVVDALVEHGGKPAG